MHCFKTSADYSSFISVTQKMQDGINQLHLHRACGCLSGSSSCFFFSIRCSCGFTGISLRSSLHLVTMSDRYGLCVLVVFPLMTCSDCLPETEGRCRSFDARCNPVFLQSCEVKRFDVCCLLCLCNVGLQSTRLGMYIEDRVNKYLKRQNHPEAGEVFVRVVASSDKTVEVKPGMKTR